MWAQALKLVKEGVSLRTSSSNIKSTSKALRWFLRCAENILNLGQNMWIKAVWASLSWLWNQSSTSSEGKEFSCLLLLLEHRLGLWDITACHLHHWRPKRCLRIFNKSNKDFSKRRFPGVDSRHEKAFTYGRDKMEYKVVLAFFLLWKLYSFIFV